ncbi:DMT family transporter [Dactylosporangium matsuzakiense]|uniref:Membrane protein n=1 Tax=Dactylosporangium matsuzakiense TaxID=53360 RepID=A0A9W6NQU5_9ACTN|nr:DMT family transporter [Dactylosporangium matsuzakiense]UWZ47656.1 DMT family transporter [Dactylosporangium matsuzakiense]GLL05606.1 membrane protein [Dactylosporangium matsuzakiense]
MSAVVLSVLAAAMFTTSAAMQQRAARRANPDIHDRALPVRLFLLIRRLVKDRWWLAGWVLNVFAFAAHAVALHLGSLTVVQALLVSQLLFAMLTIRHPPARAWIGTGLVCSGLALLVVARPSVPHTLARDDVGPAVAIAAGVMVLFIALAHLLPARAETKVRGALAGTAAGVCTCLTAVFVVLVADTLTREGIWGLTGDWATLGLIASTTASGLLTQDAFAAGSLPTALTAISIADPLASAVFDATVFRAGWRSALWFPWSQVVVVALLAAGVALLAAARVQDRAAVPVQEPTA